MTKVLFRRFGKKVLPFRATIQKPLEMGACGAWIVREKYGDRSSQNNNGWEIDHILPESEGGTDNLFNLRPLQWFNNCKRGDGPLSCPIKSIR